MRSSRDLYLLLPFFKESVTCTWMNRFCDSLVDLSEQYKCHDSTDSHIFSRSHALTFLTFSRSHVSHALTSLTFKCPGRDSNPHIQLDTCPSNMPVYQFQHPGGWGAKI